jgi:hypothetical protein
MSLRLGLLLSVILTLGIPVGKVFADVVGVHYALGSNGLSSLTFNGTEFLYYNSGQPKFVYITLDGNGGQISANFPVRSTSVNIARQTLTNTYDWGMMAIQYATPSNNNLSLRITFTNVTSDKIINQFWFFPLGINMPSPVQNPIPTSANNIDAPTSIWANYGLGSIDLVNDDIKRPLGVTLWPAESPFVSKCLVSMRVGPLEVGNPSTPPLRPIPPGASDTYTLSLRFGQPGQTESELASDIFRQYNTTYPPKVQPLPRQPIASLFPNSNFQNNPAFATNPRGWFNDPTIDVTTVKGTAAFQDRLLKWADGAVTEMRRMGAQGEIIWCIEGQQLPTSYVGDPSQAETLAPELLGVLDQFIKKFTDAGFKTGFTLRTQIHTFYKGTVNVSGNKVTLISGAEFDPAWMTDLEPQLAMVIGQKVYNIQSVASSRSLTLATNAETQTNVSYELGQQHNPQDPEPVLRSKVQYAYQRWGATLFYVDSDANWAGNVNPAQMFEDLVAEFPGVVFFPEERSTRDWAYTHPYIDATNNDPEPEYSAAKVYPSATGLVSVPGDEGIDAKYWQLLQAVRKGNTLLFAGWYRHHANDVVKQIYDTSSR